MRSSRALAFSSLVLAALVPTRAHAANILFVADGTADTGVATALMADGHEVTSRLSDLDFSGTNASFVDGAALAEYDAIFWSLSGGSGGGHTNPTVWANLNDYVMAGGRVMMFGYDGSLYDPDIHRFLGVASAEDEVGVAPGPIAMLDTSLTVGAVDLRGVVPSDGSYDKDCLSGLGPDVTFLVGSGGSTSCAQWTLRSLGDGEIAWVSNGDYGGSHPSWTTPTSAFNGVLRNFAGAADAGSSEPGAPEIELDRVYSADEGAEVTLTVTVTDPEGDAVTFSWDLDDDGTFGEAPGATSHTVAAGTTDGNTNLRFSVQASDGSHTSTRTRTVRIRNVAPRIVSDPPPTTSVGANIRYRIEVEEPAGALDPLTYTVVRGPMGAAITEDGIFVWRPTELDVTMADERIAVEVAVDDGDGGTGNQAWEMTVSPNHAPSSVTMLYPANGVAIIDDTPRLVVSNASDEDILDTMTYFFELSTSETFEGEPLARGEMIEQTPGFSTYQIPEALPYGRYWWRAWAFDGSAESEPAVTSFFVVPDPDADAGPIAVADAGVDSGRGPVDRPIDRSTCACAAPGAGRTGAAGSMLLALGALALVVARRRPR